MVDAIRAGAVRLVIGVAWLAAGATARAHGIAAGAGPSGQAVVEPWVVLSMALAAIAYIAGVRRLWARSATGHGVAARQAIAFAAGMAVLAGALLPPLDAWAGRSFAAHMVQHELLMLVAAPLLVAGRPLAAFAWALPPRGRRRWRALVAPSFVRTPWRFATSPPGAAALQLGALALWHVPALFDLAASHRGWHALQHASFLAAALCFWWSLRAPRGAAAHVRGLACLFVTTLATGALGALLAFAEAPWYAAAGAVDALGWDALGDQQAGGLVMWIPGGVAYLVAALAQARHLLRPRTSTDWRRATAAGALRVRDAAP